MKKDSILIFGVLLDLGMKNSIIPIWAQFWAEFPWKGEGGAILFLWTQLHA